MKQIKTRLFGSFIADKIKWNIQLFYIVWRSKQMTFKNLYPGDKTYPIWIGIDYFNVIRYYEDIDE